MVATSSYNIAIVLFVALSALTYGYAFSVFSTSIGQPSFYAYFALAQSGPGYAHTNSILGALNSLFSAGAAFGALSMGWLPDWVGRRRAIVVAAAVALVGGALVAGSVNIPMMIVMRLLHGVGVGQCITITPIYLTEVAPPNRRGFLTGQNAVALVLGYVLAAWVGYGTYFASNSNGTFAWRFPLALACLFPLVLLAGSPWIPESPRWLLWQEDRVDEAWAVTAKLHHDPTDASERLAKEEFYQMRAQIDADKAAAAAAATTTTGHGQGLGMWHMFRTPSLRRRLLLGCGVLFGSQASGALVINNYSVVLYEGLGLTGSLPLLMYAVYVCVGIVFNFVSAAVMDRVGRRRLLLGGWGGTAVILSIETALVARFAGTDNKGGNAAAVVFLFLFVAVYGLCIDGTAYVYCAEVFPNLYRAKGVALGLFTYYLASIAFLTPAATALDNIGWRFYLVFICCDVVAFALAYVYLPETAGLSLEEVSALFGDDVVVRLTHATADEKRAMDEAIEEREMAAVGA